MKEVIKNYNFCNFNYKVQKPCVSKNELLLEDFYNVSASASGFGSVFGFVNFYKNIFGEELFELFKNNYSNLINSTIYITDFEYISQSENDSKAYYFLLDSEFKLYKLIVLNNSFEVTYLNIQFAGKPEIFKSNGKIYFYLKNDKFIYYNSNIFITISDFADIFSITDYLENTFFVSLNDKYRVYYDARSNIEDFNNNLSIYDSIEVNADDGEILKLVKFKNNLFVIQQFAISKIISQGDGYYSSTNCFIKSKIIENSICEFNDYLIFYSTSGLYIFDGNEIKQIFENETEKITQVDEFKALIFDNKYYALAKTRIGEEEKNVLMEFDINSESFKIFTKDEILDFYVLKSSKFYDLIILSKNAENYELLKLDKKCLTTEKKYIKFNKICFDDNISKSLVGIKTISSGNFNMKISTDKTERIFNSSGELDISAFGLNGYAFDLEIYSDLDFEIKSILFRVKTISEQLWSIKF